MHEEVMINDKALDWGLPALRSPIENIDVEKPSNNLDKNVTKDESYDEPSCTAGFHEKADELNIKK